MRLRSLEIEGFRCFYEKVMLPLGRVGLFFITGTNDCDPLGTNGVGKSTLWDALSWCLMGKTSDGVRGPSLRSRGYSGTTVVKVAFDLYEGEDSRTFEVTRTMAPNALTLSSEGKVRVVEQTDLNKLLGFDFDTFHAFVIFGQGRPTFLSLTRSGRVEMLSRCLDLDKWQARSDLAKSRRNKVESVVNDHHDELGNHRSAYTELTRTILEARKQRMALKSKLSELVGAQKVVTDGLESQIEDLSAKMLRLADYIEQKSSKADKLSEFMTKLEATKLDVGVEVMKYKAEHDKCASLSKVWQGEDECPTCGQSVEGVREEKLDDLLKKQRDSLDKCVAYTRRLNKIDDRIAQVDKALEVNREKRNKGLRLANKLVAKRGQLYIKLKYESESNAEIAKLRGQLEAVSASIKDHLERRSVVKEKAIKYKKMLASAEATYQGYSYWVDGFKQIRLVLLADAVKLMNAQANAHLSVMGLGNWHFTFSFVAGSNDQYHLNVDVSNQADNKPIPWESCSGGEQQRLKLAAAFAFVDTLNAHRNLVTNVEVWDEPSAGLSEEGIEDLVEALHDRSQNLGKQLWLVDHNAISSAMFDGVLRLRKRGEGESTIEAHI